MVPMAGGTPMRMLVLPHVAQIFHLVDEAFQIGQDGGGAVEEQLPLVGQLDVFVGSLQEDDTSSSSISWMALV